MAVTEHSGNEPHINKLRLTTWPRATGRAKLLLVVLAFLLLQMILVPSRVWYFLLFVFTTVLILSYFWTLALAKGIQVGRSCHRLLVQVGDKLVEDFAVANYSILPAPWIEIHDYSDLPGYTVSVLISLTGQDEIHWQSGGICRQRGQFSLGPWQVRTGDPFGLFIAGGNGNKLAELLVYPPIGRVPLPVLESGTASSERSLSRRALEQTTTAASIREYVSGDSPRYIHWPSSARNGQIMVKQFDQQPAGAVWLVLDLAVSAQAGQFEESTEEYMVIAAASLAARLFQRNQAVGLLAYGDESICLPPARGESQYWQVMRALAVSRATGKWPLMQVLQVERQRLRAGAGIVLCATDASVGLAESCERLRRIRVATGVFLFPTDSFGRNIGSQAVDKQLDELGTHYWLFPRGYEFITLSKREKRRLKRLPAEERWGLQMGKKL